MNTFIPPRGLRNPHVQGIASRLPLRRQRIVKAMRELAPLTQSALLHSHDAQLLAFYTPALRDDAPLAILLHGWEGSSESIYLQSTTLTLHQQGWAVLRLNLRDHGDSHHLNVGLFHSCREQEVAQSIEDALRRWPSQTVALIGFSLGGNFCLRITTLLPERLPVKQVIAVCPVIDPASTMQALENGPWLYRHYFLHKWRQSLQRKLSVFPDMQARLNWRGQRTLTEMTAHFVAQHTDFTSLQHYLRGYAINNDRLLQVRFPTRVILTADDPVIPASGWQQVRHNQHVQCTVLPFGGHCGFIANWKLDGWIEQHIAQLLRPLLASNVYEPATIEESESVP